MRGITRLSFLWSILPVKAGYLPSGAKLLVSLESPSASSAMVDVTHQVGQGTNAMAMPIFI